jgi:hypothetical protein
MKVKDLIMKLQQYDKEAVICVGSDEELNSVFTEIEVDEYETNAVVIFGLSGSDLNA